MLLSENKWIILDFIVFIAGALGETGTLCVLKGSSVNLPCLAEYPAEQIWFAKSSEGDVFVLDEFSANGNDAAYKISEDGNFTLTIVEVKEEDENLYCCGETPENLDLCWMNAIEIQVADLQVDVFPTSNEQAMNLMCTTSCPLTEIPTAYIWYKNRELLYENWSPWYQELVTKDETVKYSCSIKDYVNTRAPEVSVDSITPNCFKVTYASKGKCSHDFKSMDKSCTITYPRDVHVQLTSSGMYVILTCNTSCPAADPHTAFKWFYGEKSLSFCTSQHVTISKLHDKAFSCAVQNNDALHSDEICINPDDCPYMKYDNRRICALEGSSVEISREILPSYTLNIVPQWYKVRRNFKTENDTWAMMTDHNQLKSKNHTTLRLSELSKNDSAEYKVCFLFHDEKCSQTTQGVMLIVTGLTVTMIPSAEVTSGQRVTLTCSSSCPLPGNTTYIWIMNNQILSQTENQMKHLILDPVESQHAGNYSCAISSSELINSPVQVLIVKGGLKLVAILNVAKLILVVFFSVLLIIFYKTKAPSLPKLSEGKKDETK